MPGGNYQEQQKACLICGEKVLGTGNKKYCLECGYERELELLRLHRKKKKSSHA